MSVKVSVNQLQKHLPEILDRTVADGDVCVIERDGEGVAVMVSLPEWRRRTVGSRLDALGPEYRLAEDKQRRVEELLGKSSLTRKEQRELDALLREAEEILLLRAEALASV